MNVYLTDGTADAFFTAAYHACTDADCIVTSARNFQLALGANVIETAADAEKCARVRRRIAEYDREALSDILLILRRGSAGREMTALRYLRRLIRQKAPVRNMLADPAVRDAMDERRKVTLEAHRFTGFLRFMQSAGGVFYAPFSPDNDILELIAPHFMRRFGDMPFVIHDLARKKAALFRSGKMCVVPVGDDANVLLHEDELVFQSLWREYYRAVNISERPHEKQMKGYMPVRYWKHMPEKQNESAPPLSPGETRGR